MNSASSPYKYLPFGLLLLLPVTIFYFISFSATVKKDFLWFNNSDQNTYLIKSALDYNEGFPAKTLIHPGIGAAFTYSTGYSFFKKIGLTEIAKVSDFSSKDPIAQLPTVYKVGGDISILILLLCAFLMAFISYILLDGNLLIAAYVFVATLFSGGFLFHSVMLRNELTTTYYFLLACLFFCLAYHPFSEKRYPLKIVAYLIGSGFFLAFSYFTKSQIILSIVFLFLFFFYFQFRKKILFPATLPISLGLFSLNLLLLFYLGYRTSIFHSTFWLLSLGLFIVAAGITVLNQYDKKYTHNFFEYSYITASLGTGFLLGMIYIFEIGLRGNKKLINLTIEYTDLFQGEGKELINFEYGGILERFLYFLQQLFVESPLLLGLICLILFFRQKGMVPYLLAIVGIIIMCYFHSLRVMLPINIGRAVYKYMIFIDVFVVLLTACIYVNSLQQIKSSVNKLILHGLFWILLVAATIKNYHKVENDVIWNFTTYAWGVFPEGNVKNDANTFNNFFNKSYTGFYNGHDRVFLGNEIKRGQKELPIPQWQFDRTHKVSLKRYLYLFEKTFSLDATTQKAIQQFEQEVFNFKINLFKQGVNYQNILKKITFRRIQAYKNILPQQEYELYIKLINKGQLTVPF